MKILLLSSEVAPFAKTGGLADVAGALPKALRRLGHDVRIMLPYYREIAAKGFPAPSERKSVTVTIAGQDHRAGLRQGSLDGVPVYFVENREYFDREGLYGSDGRDYPDNAERFGFFNRAALQLLKRIDFRPEVIHVNDWQTGLVPVLLRTELQLDPFFAGIRTLMSIHNLGYQGLFPPPSLATLGLDPRLDSMEAMEYYGQISFLKGGIVFADAASTVSETYCREIQTPELGFGFDGILRHKGSRLFGVLNGLDPKQWDPTLNGAIPAPYDAVNLRGKAATKKQLQKELGLPLSASLPLLGMVTRLDSQKGLDLMEAVWPQLMARPLQLVLLGSGEQGYSARMAELGRRFPQQASINLFFDEGLARRIYAGSDLFLMPSRYEPCGLSQLIALRYGSVPLVRHTGGLADTITDIDADPRHGNGFSFGPATPEALLAALDRALARFAQRRTWLQLVRRGMTQDFSWNRAAEHYLDIYHTLTEQPRVN